MKPKLFAMSALLLVAGSAFAQATPVGLWKTIDDDTKKERSLVRIADHGGVLSGKVEKYLDPSIAADTTCDKCTDDRKDQLVLGMTIVRGIKKDTDRDLLWNGGTVLDPANGKAYKARLMPIDGGKKLEVRGYIGVPMFGRTQTWIRAD
jgi:uncharacterized protein (DUF2147 family)